jgi:hypothetical protein
MSENLPGLFNLGQTFLLLIKTISYLPETPDIAVNETWNALIYDICLVWAEVSDIIVAYTVVWRRLPYQTPCTCQI